jgi:hypothetical protein
VSCEHSAAAKKSMKHSYDFSAREEKRAPPHDSIKMSQLDSEKLMRESLNPQTAYRPLFDDAMVEQWRA